jgi:sialate O-acetylesterase
MQILFASAQLRVAPQFSDNMVLQSNRPITIWGTGNSGSLIRCRFKAFTSETRVDKNGQWKLQLPPNNVSAIPETLRIEMERESISLNNILIGDVWLCIGQSNMEWPMSGELHWKTEQEKANQPLIRFLNPPPAGRYVYNVRFKDSLLKRLNEEKFYLWDGWKISTQSTVAEMSAVAYFFAKRIQQDVNLPIGLINLSIGGAPLESFIGEDALLTDADFKQKVQGNWLFNDALPVWIRQRGLQNLENVNYRYGDENGPNHAFKPGFAFKSGVLPLKDLPISGVLVYQGESNAEETARVEEYGKLFRLLTAQYRQLWGSPELPFYWVQLSSIERPLWPVFREEQRKLLDSIKYSGMAVTTDHGLPNDVHPPNKKIVGERLARWALKDVYRLPIVASGPIPVRAKYKRHQVVVRFSHADGLQTSDGEPLREFSFDGKTSISAKIRNKKLVIPALEKPDAVWYGWQPFNKGNLVNKEGLPASTFHIPINK